MAAGAMLLVGATGSAWARPRCGDAVERTSWLSESEMKSRIMGTGYRIDVFKVTAEGCYEIYGRDQSGMRIEVYYHPVTGEVVRSSR